jgi:hypothetical protein
VSWSTVGVAARSQDVRMRTRSGKTISAKVAAAAALVVLAIGGSATVADAMAPSPNSQLCGQRTLTRTIERIPATLGGPYVLNLHALCVGH